VLRRLFLALPFTDAGLWGWRIHLLARHECANGPMLTLLLRGEPWKLTERERELTDWIAEKMRELDPQTMQQNLPKRL